MDIKLKERQVKVLGDLEIRSTFKIPESSFVYMKMDVTGLSSVTSRPQNVDGGMSDPEPTKVEIPEGKTPVVCLDTGKAQFLDLKEKVDVVILEAIEIVKEKGE